MFNRVFLSCFFTIGVCFFVIAEPPKYGNVPLESLQSTTYVADSTMEAEIIYDIGDVHFSYRDNFGFEIIFERKTRIKIYTKQGFERANISIPYYIKDNYSAESVREIEGASYNIENGVIARTTISKKDIYEVDLNENWKQKVFALPNVKEGSIIEYKYTITSPYYVNLREWIFQHSIPARWSEYKVTIPAFFDYQMLKQGFLKFDVEEAKASALKHQLGPYTYTDAIYQWILKEVPAFRDEKYITTPDDYIAKIEFQLSHEKFPGRREANFMTTWDELIRKMLKETDFGSNYGKTTSEQKDLVAGLITSKATELEKAQAIYDYLHASVLWNGEMRRQPTVSAKKLLEIGSGNCTDINLIFVNLLNLAGIDAKPVLLSTRDNGKIFMDYPFLHKFNYTIGYANIDGKDILLDATDPFLPLGMISPDCLNGYGLVVDDQEARWIKLETAGIYFQNTQVTMQPNSNDQNFTTQIMHRYDGFAALEQRKALDQKQSNKAKSEDIEHGSEFSIENMDNIKMPLIVNYTTTATADPQANLLYINLFEVDAVKENPFKAPQRYFPVNFNYRQVYQYILKIEIPEGYILEEIPEPVQQKLDDNSVQFIFMAQHIEETNTVQIFSKIIINESEIGPKQYLSLRALYDSIVDKHSSVLVLRKNH